MKIQRYDLSALEYHQLFVEEDDDGEWVKWEDIKDVIVTGNVTCEGDWMKEQGYV